MHRPTTPTPPGTARRFEALAKHYKFSLDTPFGDLPKKAMDAILLRRRTRRSASATTTRRAPGHFEYESPLPRHPRTS
ncbi:MAG: hypothetical protein MZV70_56820 [Desulfobacterales bacterium]|nr:hypothetical protein [Desulfobacterales bacterium]